jgi:4-amino-4-deoxy-L-arabinose transferase-like glycosyltransferase
MVMTRSASVRSLLLVVPAVLLFYFLALDSLVLDSPTMDEQNHLARGLAFLRTGDPRLSVEHPPLVNVLSAMPLLTMPDIRLPTDHPSWDQPYGWYGFADQLLWSYNNDAGRMIFLARLPIVWLTLGLALVAYHFGKELWGWPASLVAFLFVLFDPNVLAHGRYTTTDIGGITFLLLSALLLWRMWLINEWSWSRLLMAGIALGLAFTSKLSNLGFIPIFALLSLLPLYGTPWKWPEAGRRIAQFGAACLITLPIIWALFAFEWGPLKSGTDVLKPLAGVPLPMPTFLGGLGQVLGLSGGGRPAFLLGQFSTEGWWYYFPTAFLVKTPLPVIALFVLASVVLFKDRISRGRAAYLLIPAVFFFLIIMQSGLNIGYRHLLPILPFLYVLASGLVGAGLARVAGSKGRRRAIQIVVIASLLIVLIIDLRMHPHYLSYFNALAGGPENGHRVLIDSNIDWGQDLGRLKKWMTDNDVERLKLAWFGSSYPSYYDISYDPLPGFPRHVDLWLDLPFDPNEPQPGIYAISASNLWELLREDKSVFSWFREREPDHKIGYSIFIYYVGEDA